MYKYSKKHNFIKRSRRNKIVMALAGLVVFITTYALILPAITISDKDAAEEPGMYVSGGFSADEAYVMSVVNKILQGSSLEDAAAPEVQAAGYVETAAAEATVTEAAEPAAEASQPGTAIAEPVETDEPVAESVEAAEAASGNVEAAEATIEEASVAEAESGTEAEAETEASEPAAEPVEAAEETVTEEPVSEAAEPAAEAEPETEASEPVAEPVEAAEAVTTEEPLTEAAESEVAEPAAEAEAEAKAAETVTEIVEKIEAAAAEEPKETTEEPVTEIEAPVAAEKTAESSAETTAETEAPVAVEQPEVTAEAPAAEASEPTTGLGKLMAPVKKAFRSVSLAFTAQETEEPTVQSDESSGAESAEAATIEGPEAKASEPAAEFTEAINTEELEPAAVEPAEAAVTEATEAAEPVETSTDGSIEAQPAEPTEPAIYTIPVVTHPEQIFQAEEGGLWVGVIAPRGALPAGSRMVLGPADTEALRSTLDSSVDGTITGLAAVDISFVNADGKEIEPEKPVTVAIHSELVSEENSAVVHMGALGPDFIADTKSSNDYVVFRSGSFSVYGIYVTILDRIITASDGLVYNITASYGPEAGLPMKGTDLSVSEITEDSENYSDYIRQSAELLNLEEDSIRYARLFDISIMAEGEALQPAGGSVSVRIELEDTDSKRLKVVHFGEQPELIETTNEAGSVSFEADGFSVYTVIDHEGGTVENPRVMFHFISNVGAAETTSGSGIYSANPYSFVNKGGYRQTTQILADGEALEMIADPPNVSENYFYGWYVVDPEVIGGTTDEYGIGTSDSKLYYSWPGHPKQITFESPISIAETNVAIGSTVNWTLNGVSGSGKVDEDGNVHVFTAPIFEAYNFVDFMLHPYGSGSNNMIHRKMIVRGSSPQIEEKISDIRSNSTDPVHLIFTGWEYNAGTSSAPNWIKKQTVDYTGAEIKDPGKDGVYVNINLDDTSSVDFYPIFVEARWIDFDSDPGSSGATYVASRFLESWTEPPVAGMTPIEGRNVASTLTPSEKKGYAFDGWYAFAALDPTTGAITNLDTPAPVKVSYVDVEHKYDIKTVTVNTKAVRLTTSSGAIYDSGIYSVTDNGDGTGTLNNDNSGQILLNTTGGMLKLYDALDRLKLYGTWKADESRITVVYWTEDAEGNYVSNAALPISTADLNSKLPGTYGSGLPITFNELDAYTSDAGISVLSTAFLDDIEAVPAGEQIFYDRIPAGAFVFTDTDGKHHFVDSTVTIGGDGNSFFNVFYSRKVFKLVFHIGRDNYVKAGGNQKTAEEWDGNWIEYMFHDTIVRDLGYQYSWNRTHGRNPTDPISGNFSMTYIPDSKTVTSGYAANFANVKGDYVPDPDHNTNDQNLYIIEAKYGAYIGDRWPSPVNPNFSFTNPEGAQNTMYIWAAYYGSLYCRIANERADADVNNRNPDINGVYNYMSAELCSNRDGTEIINANQVHHLVAYFGKANNNQRFKQYHILYEAIPGAYDTSDSAITVVDGADYASYPMTSWSEANTSGDRSEIIGRQFYEISTESPRAVISDRAPKIQLSDAIDGYEFVYSCYESAMKPNPVTGKNEYHIYFFYRPKQYSLTFMYEDGPKTDYYYYNQSLADAKKYADPEKEGYEFTGWYNNEAGVGEPFDFANEKMPSSSIVLYPTLKILQYPVKIDPNGGVIDHSQNSSMSTYFTANYGTPVGEYSIERGFIKLTAKEQDPSDTVNYYDQDWYYYVNTQRLDPLPGETVPLDGDWGYPQSLRNAVYLTSGALDAYYDDYCSILDSADPTYWTNITKLTKQEFIDTFTDYPYRPVKSEHYSFMGWYKVHDDGSVDNMPYNFNDPVKGELELRAKWRLDDGIYIQYNPYFLADDGAGGTTLVVGEMEQWSDPKNPSEQLYSDQSMTNVLRAPSLETVTSGWIFRGWRVVRKDESSGTTIGPTTYYNWIPIQLDGNGDPVYYQPGDDFFVDAELISSTDLLGSIIHMQAYYEPETTSYRRPDITNLILDANSTYGGYVNTTDSAILPALAGPGSSIIETGAALDGSGRPTQILFGDIQSNLALHLYQYATTETTTFGGITGTKFFSNEDGHLLIGFDENSDPLVPTTGKAYIPAYAPNSVVSVSRNTTDAALYAMWEPMVYVTFVNTTAEDITVDLTGTGSSTISVVNIATGEFDREASTNSITIPASSGGISGEVKIVLPRANAGSDKITATAVNDHSGQKMHVSGALGTTDPYGTGSSNIKYNKPVTYTGMLQTDATGIVVTYTEEPDDEVSFDVNGGVWTEASTDYVYQDDGLYVIEETSIINNQYHPKDPTHASKVFVGWTTNAAIAAHTDFSTTAAITFGDGTVITPDAGSNVLAKLKSDYIWDFEQEEPIGSVLYAVWSDPVTVKFDLAYEDNGSKLHTWSTGSAITTTPGAYEFYQSSPSDRYVTYTLAKGDFVPKPEDPTVISLAVPDTSSWNFIKWLINNSAVNDYKRKTVDPTDQNVATRLSTYGFDFSQPVINDVTLISSWTAAARQIFTFTVENHVEGGKSSDEFEYRIEIADVLVYGKMNNSSLQVGAPNNTWGSLTTTLKKDQIYTVRITVTRKPATPYEYSAWVEVINDNGLVIKEAYLQECIKQKVYHFVSDYKYTLKITQTPKSGYSTDVTVNNVVPAGNIDYSIDLSNLRYNFYVEQYGRSGSFTSNSNSFESGENNSLTIVFTNTGEYTDVKLNKLDELANALKGAKFSLQKLNASSVYEDFNLKETAGVYEVYASGSAVLDMTNSTSALMLLPNGTYKLTETQAPGGYMIAADSYEFLVSAGAVQLLPGQSSDISLTTPGGIANLNVVNYQGAQLPSTGSTGTGFYTGLGAILTIGAAAVLIIRRKRAR